MFIWHSGWQARARLNDVAILFTPVRWVGRFFLGDGWLVYAGPVGATTAHAHHAYQLIRCLDGSLGLRGDGETEAVACTAAIIPPDAVHTMEAGALAAAMVYVDPDVFTGRRLRRGVTNASDALGWQHAGQALTHAALDGLPQTWTEARTVHDLFVRHASGAQPRAVPMHPAVLRARAWLATHLMDGNVSLERVASEVGLSADRLSHLLNDELGIGLRPLILWLRLQRAAQNLARGQSLSTSADAAGFADGAHMTRTFRRMFGLAPSEVVGFAEWVLPE